MLWYIGLAILLCINLHGVAPQEGETDIIDVPGSDDVTQEEGVYVLTPTNFDAFIESHDTVMVEFYAPWCGHCKKLAPEYAAAAAEVPGMLAKVDADAHSELGNRFGVQGFPTLKIFKKGVEDPMDYDGGRTKDDIVLKMKELSDPNWTPPKSKVIELTTETFDDIVNSQPIMLVEFFAPWCGHCKKLKPEYEKAAISLAYSNIPLATVDATVERDLATRFGVTGYPTLKIFRHGKASDYKGDRKADDIISTMITEMSPHSLEITTSYDKKEVEKPAELIVIGFFPGLDKDSVEYKLYEELTNEYRSSYFCKHTFDANYAKKAFKVTKPTLVIAYPSLYVAKKEKPFVSTAIAADSSISDLQSFITANNKPLAGDYDCSRCSAYYDTVDTVRVYTSKDYDHGFDKNTKYWQEKTASVARRFAGKGLHFVLCDESKHSSDMMAMKLIDLGVETVFGIKTAEGNKYSPSEDTLDEMDDFAETLEEFVNDYLAGKLTVRRKSAPVPRKQTGPVTTVVGSTFNDIVLDTSKDVLIEFYAPWCGHCKQLEPKYTKLASELKSEKNLVIAKIDGTANEYPPEFKISGFPQIFLVPAGTSKPALEYDGEREVDALKKFVQENSVLAFGNADVKDEL